jgi:hypothetical protein
MAELRYLAKVWMRIIVKAELDGNGRQLLKVNAS